MAADVQPMPSLEQRSLADAPDRRRALTEYDPFFQEDDETLDLTDYWRTLVKRKWAVLSLLTIVFVATVVATFLMRPVYKATSTIQINEETSKILEYQELNAVQPGQQNFYPTQYGILRSRSLVRAVIEKLNLLKNPEIGGGVTQRGLLSGLLQLLRALSDASATAQEPNPQEVMAKAIDRFLERLHVEPVRNSKLVHVSFTSFDPELAMQVTNTLINEYIQSNLQRRFDAGKEAREFLQNQIATMQAALERSDQTLQDFARNRHIADLEEYISLASNKLKELHDELTKMEVERLNTGVMRDQIRAGQGDALDVIVNNPLIDTLQAQYVEARAEYARLTAQFKPEYPAMMELKNQVDQLEEQINTEKQRVLRSILQRYQNLAKQSDALQSAIEAQENALLALNQQAVQYNILKREVETNKELYEGLLQRMKEIGVASGAHENNIAVIDAAQVPPAPFKPKPMLNSLLALLLGTVGGVGLAFFLEYLDNTVRRPEEVETLLGLPTLGVIPRVKAGKRGPRQQGGIPEEVAFHSLHHGKSEISEAFRSLRTSLMFSSPEGMPKTLLVTSPGPNEGKTTVAINLATVLAQSGERVLLIDADLRKPRLHKLFGKPQIPGLTQCIADRQLSGAVCVHDTEVDGLFVLTSGTIPPNPAELLAPGRMREVLDEVGQPFDYVILDTAPVLGLADVLVLSRVSQGVAMVAAGGDTTKQGLKYAVKRLRQVHAPLLGVVLNAVSVESPDYAYYTGYYYSTSEPAELSDRRLEKIA
jgi:capsular exopolysaccharide family